MSKASDSGIVYNHNLTWMFSGRECIKDYNGLLTDATEYSRI